LKGEEEIGDGSVVIILKHSMTILKSQGTSHANKWTENKNVCNG